MSLHTVMPDYKDTWCVMRSDTSDGNSFLTPMFNKLSFGSAMALVNCLNGGESLTSDQIKILEMCKVKQSVT